MKVSIYHYTKQFSKNLTLHLRRMVANDIERISELEAGIFASPWSSDSFYAELLHQYSICLVAETEDLFIVAYTINWFIEDELHIANLAVDPQYRQLGIASWILDTLMNIAESIQTRIVHLEVRKSNLQAIKLYEKYGFEIVGMRKNYYEKENEDALLMSLKI